MTRSKLSASDREELIRLFKETTETITSLANQFEVSISTARRVLKTQLSAEEYEAIVASRQGGRQGKKQGLPKPTSTTVADVKLSEPSAESATPDTETIESSDPKEKPKARRRRRRSSATADDAPQQKVEAIQDKVEDNGEDATSIAVEDLAAAAPSTPSPSEEVAPPDFEEEDLLEVLPIDDATLPNQCYLVVDRSSELITPPLREFSELGRIPSSEESAKTLPVFANHKIASRFSRRSQRIIKIPNSGILKKTYPLLNAKGVERILFEGQVFTLG